jgi:hypothetical protein|tara:strand:- start:856 stop:1053 length:198 start_codon:yes stop_codon:yes gene_type:complete
MIKKWIKSLIEKVFGKFCKCEEKDEHLQLYEDVPEPDIKVEKIKCVTHYPRYKKSCTVCRTAGIE